MVDPPPPSIGFGLQERRKRMASVDNIIVAICVSFLSVSWSPRSVVCCVFFRCFFGMTPARRGTRGLSSPPLRLFLVLVLTFFDG